MNNYKKLQHFVDLCPKGATIERLSHNTCKRETEDKEGILYEYTHIVIKDKTNDDIKLNTD
ncbi:MAG: hypothetical protein MK207_14865 [Saprospiraceae bacterium]|nr:hypothetical protein [Saprospiraceae bacterium]